MSFLRPVMLAMVLVPLIVISASAVFIEKKLEDPAQEARARDISGEIRCLVCQNQSILDSNADLAKDLRQIVRERIAFGETDDEVRAFLVARFGDWVLLDPPFKMTTLFLWLGPALIFLLGAFAMLVFLRSRNREVDGEKSIKLSAEEETKINELLNSDEPGKNA
ncbi:cytochrome c-type biogenesis protein CcmH [Sneathiella sp. HT1-7]|uniref:cytochrome c-type biogenesis protein n=1 Tax=Sneathiella sp. HT1-7 TaxID=2887192 RepID=UPI001D135B09|nr:cytochrome c-type biogenesis protein [Sneathiella sp. HT1-7]MCC3303662.1 cytochrome c-type biogenesis protein CcmH [Sneathiella sp. HT1-7]